MHHAIRKRGFVLATLFLFLLTILPPVHARGSFGGGGRSFGGGSFGGGRGFGGSFGGGRPSFTPPPSFRPAPNASPGSFGRQGGVGRPGMDRFTPTQDAGGSFGRTGRAGSRTFTSIGTPGGRPVAPEYAHPYQYGGRPANAYFTGGPRDYSFGHYGHPFYAWAPWTPVFYYNPPLYMGSGYVSGGFSFFRLLLGIAFWIVVALVVLAIVRHLRAGRPT